MDVQANFDQQIVTLIAGAVPGKFKKTRITPETRLQAELGLDSLGVLSLVFRFEELFGIDLAKMNIKVNVSQLKTVGDIIDSSRKILEQARSQQYV
jgi:acyl carrier protein